MAGMHRKRRRWWHRRPTAPLRPLRTVKLVDVGTLLTHLLTPDAHAAGLRPRGRYVALCGRHVLPAALVEPGNGRYCQWCLAVASVVPTQREAR